MFSDQKKLTSKYGTDYLNLLGNSAISRHVILFCLRITWTTRSRADAT